MQLDTRVRIALAVNIALALIASFLGSRVARALGMPEISAWAMAALVVIPVALWSTHWIVRKVVSLIQGLDDGLRGFRDADFSMRLAAVEGDETVEIKKLYNEVADLLRAQRADVYQKELLLDTILQRTPVAVLLVNAADRVIYSNIAARELFTGGARVDGERYSSLLEQLTEPMRDALAAGGDGIVVIPAGGVGQAFQPAPAAEQEETFHISQRTFRLNTLELRLILVERLTAELRRQEVEVWKKAIRVINHEINNTIAPVSSLFHSARLAQQRDRREQLEEIYESIDERLAFLRTFLESYAQFARLPAPRKQLTRWDEILGDVRALYDFQVEGDTRAEVLVDRAQIQQVLINLVKNAHESGSDPAAIKVSLLHNVVRVSDAGRGMSEDVLRQALVPFYSTKPGGTGVGLALSNEIIEAHGGRMRLEARLGGGTIVTCWLPS
jgi:nitrogen fixation/metabolism regulation signal transduction histidine kinase